jgi:L-aminopeptidase/D-esterase-like protein
MKSPGKRRKPDSGESNLPYAGSITEVSGISVGHAHNLEARTGCTAILCGENGATAGVDVRGAAPGTRETDLLDPSNLVEKVHAILLTGGSAFGLDAAGGVMRYLEERHIGFNATVARVPIVPAAVIFDLAVGDASVRPDASMGYAACENASSNPVEEGQIGAGAGAMIGKIAGIINASPGGVGTASIKLKGGATIGVIVVVNAMGDIIDPANGHILAGARNEQGWIDTSSLIAGGYQGRQKSLVLRHPLSGVENTTLAVVATDAKLTKAQARKVASMAHDGFARAIRPAHTMFDGDVIFALSTGDVQSDVTTVGTVAAELISQAIVRVGHRAKGGL